MVAIIGLMIGAYILVRCFEILARPDDTFNHVAWNVATKLLAVFVGLFAVFGCYTIITNSKDASAQDPRMRIHAPE